MAFCIECGQKLVDGTKFCFNCGKQVTPGQSKTTDIIDNVKAPDSKIKKSQNKQFSLFSNQIIFDGNLVNVIEVRKIFLEFAWDKRNKFIELYNSKVNTLEDLFDIGLSQFVSDMQESVNLGVKTLMKYGIDYIDNDRLTDLASGDFDVESVWQPIFDEANKIDEEAERLATYRNVQRASRSRWQGGGFGIGGAIKGALTAGAMNMATGAFRGIGDSLTNSSDRAKIAKMKKKVISSSDTLSKLSNGIYDCYFSVFYSVYEILCNEEILVYEFEDMKNHNARLNNYLELHRQKELRTNELVQFLCECIQLNPFSIRYYVELYRLGLPNRKDILSIAIFVGMKGEYQYRITSIDKMAISQIDEKMSEDTIPQLEQKIASLEEMLKENTDLSVDSYIEKYKKKISKLKEMEAKKVDSFMLESEKFFPAEKTMYIKKKLMALDDSRSYVMTTAGLKDPTTVLVFGVLGGLIGVDRFLVGDIGMGILKMLTFGGFGLWWIADLFVLPKKVRDLNFSKFMTMI